MPIMATPPGGKSAKKIAGGAAEGAKEEVVNLLKFPGMMVDFLKQSPELVKKLGGPGAAWNHMMARWNQATPQDKVNIFKGVGAVVGAIGGAIAGGGVASIPGAGGGAVIGRNLAAEVAERYFGVPRPELSQEAKEISAAFTGGGLGQAVGMAAKPIIQAVRHPMATAGNIAKSKLLIPKDPEVIATAARAASEGVPLPLGGQSERPLAQLLQTGARFNIFARDVVDDALVKAQEGWQDYLQRTAGSITGRGETSAAEAGVIIRAARQNAIDTFETASRGMYDAFRDEFGDTIIDLEVFGEKARSFMQKHSSPEARKLIFPPETLKTLEAAASLRPKLPKEAETLLDELNKMAKGMGGREAADLPETVASSYISRRSAELGIEVEDLASLTEYLRPPKVTMTQMHNLRSELLRVARDLGDKAPGIQKKALYELTENADEAIEAALPVHGQNEFASINKFYREGKEQLFGPSARRKAGNLMADTIDATRDDSGLVGSIVKPGKPDRLENAMRALTPPGAEAPPAGLRDAIKRATLDDLVAKAAVESRETADFAVSPFKLRKGIFKLRETGEKLFGSSLQELDEVSDVGTAIYRTEKKFANPSGTAFAGQAIQFGLHTLPGAAVGAGTFAATGDIDASLKAGLGVMAGGMMARKLGKKIVDPDFLAPSPTGTLLTKPFGSPETTAAAIRTGIEAGKKRSEPVSARAPAAPAETVEDFLGRKEETVEEFLRRQQAR